jgi:L-ascorbate metabolism protein UlaG (beta-lactamase superfamily)
MRIVWHGHSCFEVNGSSTVVVDPHDGKSIGIKTPVVKADVVLISHDHFDHNCARVVKGDFIMIRELGERAIDGVKVLGVKAYHDDVRGNKMGPVIMYRFEMDDVTFCHCGDLGHVLDQEQIEALTPIDVLFIPVGGAITVDGGLAHKIVDQLRPKIVIPMHFRMGGLSLSIQTIDSFLDKVDDERVFRVGNEVEIMPEDLPAETEYWVFSP